MIATTLVRLLTGLGHEVRSYSGRGMRGRECVGVVVPGDTSMFTFGVELALAAADIDINVVYNLSKLVSRTDDMGRHNIIVYFPDVDWPSDL